MPPEITSTADATLRSLVNRKERIYYAVALVASLLIYLWFAATAALLSATGMGAGVIAYALAIVAFVFLSHGLLVGHVRGNGVLVSSRQFPELHRMLNEGARDLGMPQTPDAFVLQAGGMLNAFATRFMGRDFVVFYSDVVELAQRRGGEALRFIAAHELAHHKRGHLRRRWLIAPARMIPFVGAAYSRACEYTCDRFGAHCAPEGAVDGLLVLAAGKDLHAHVDPAAYARQATTETGFWVRLAELLSSHPHLTKRVGALLGAGVTRPAVLSPSITTPGSVVAGQEATV